MVLKAFLLESLSNIHYYKNVSRNKRWIPSSLINFYTSVSILLANINYLLPLYLILVYLVDLYTCSLVITRYRLLGTRLGSVKIEGV
jgi:hypothetical protein